MTARILVVDDIPTNRRLLEARLMAEYFQVLTATNGEDALKICQQGLCDIVLLDVIMPGMDGFEVCRTLKFDPATMHLPVVMVTALNQPEDKVKGLEAGADDFLTKPVNDLALVTRVKSLARLKMLTDDLRLRAANGDALAIENIENTAQNRANIVIVDDDASSYRSVVKALSENHTVSVITKPNDALLQIAEDAYDLVIVSADLDGHDSLRLCSYLRSIERTRTLPIIVLAKTGQEDLICRAMELGVNDYLRHPIDENELKARVKTQMRRKNYNDCLRNSVQQTIELAVKDPLTGLHNRRYFEAHFDGLFEKAEKSASQLSVIMCDIDHFKAVNDTFGHQAGDAVIKECAARIQKNIRNVDMACRFGGEEFVIVMPDTTIELANLIAERIREEIAAHPIVTDGGKKQISVTLSMGVSNRMGEDDSPHDLIKRADEALYSAKGAGRNRVELQAA